MSTTIVRQRSARLVLETIDNPRVVGLARRFGGFWNFCLGRDVGNPTRIRRPRKRFTSIGDEEVCRLDYRKEPRRLRFVQANNPETVLFTATGKKGDRVTVR